MKIEMRIPESPYKTTLDTEVMDVTITEAFIGLKLVSDDGETLSISMRDSGFELAYIPGHGAMVPISLQNGEVRILK